MFLALLYEANNTISIFEKSRLFCRVFFFCILNCFARICGFDDIVNEPAGFLKAIVHFVIKGQPAQREAVAKDQRKDRGCKRPPEKEDQEKQHDCQGQAQAELAFSFDLYRGFIAFF